MGLILSASRTALKPKKRGGRASRTHVSGSRAGLRSAVVDPVRQTVRRLLDLVEAAVEAEPQEALAAGAEGGARREADIGLVDDVEGGRLGIRHAVDREEQVEGARRHAEADAAGLAEDAADDVARLLRLRSTCAAQEVVALVRARRCAPRCMNCATPDVEYWIRFSNTARKRRMRPAASRRASRSSPSSWRRC